MLHTVLLGFVKYFWRDAVTIRIGKNKIKKELLEVRLSSFDTTGLEIPPLSGHTLVQYAGSLVGRDFRAIAQAAPFVLHGLVPDQCYNTWVALSKLIPLIWQSEIDDIEVHLVSKYIFQLLNLSFACQKQLEAAIQDFLAHTARWTPRWFNKSKFHILLHLVEHVDQFGPAALFATEAFESFNAVIRAKSIHSNRQSPSRDIAKGFAHGNRIRHTLSGAHIHIRSSHSKLENQIKKLIERPPPGALNVGEAGTWWPAGIAPLELVRKPNIITDYLGMDSMSISKKGVLTCIHIFLLKLEFLQDLVCMITFPGVHIVQPKLANNFLLLSHCLKNSFRAITSKHANL